MIWKLFFFQQLHAKRGDRKREREREKNYVVGVIACFAQKRALSLLKGFFFIWQEKGEKIFHCNNKWEGRALYIFKISLMNYICILIASGSSPLWGKKELKQDCCTELRERYGMLKFPVEWTFFVDNTFSLSLSLSSLVRHFRFL